MTSQSQIILSLGSNLGDRLEALRKALAEIHHSVGVVVKVSKVYETPPWGFESDPFFNMIAVIHSVYEAGEVIEKVLEVEKRLGRVRIEESGYTARIIDIDVIAIDESIIESEKLQVPHPRMHERLFVLVPMRDLNLHWRHPILQKYLPELVMISEDKSNYKVVGELDCPIEELKVAHLNYIAIEGNIGAGKTTLATRFSEDFNAKLVLERFADNPFLPKFYEDQSRYAFPLEMSFLADRYQQLSDDLAQFDLFKDFIVADYHIFKSLIFAKVTLQEDEFRLYKTMFDIIHKETPQPDLYIYLYQNTERLLKNIKLRGRSYEQDIPAEYLEKINRGYLDYINTQTHLNVLIIDVSERDFLKFQQDYVWLLEQIQEKIQINT
jgi:deoxyguanosine kinase